jgi:hypothetical protein
LRSRIARRYFTDVGYWHLTDKPTAPALVGYWTNNGQRAAQELNGSAANDPEQALASYPRA